jgi:aspartate ammonia-lyase
VESSIGLSTALKPTTGYTAGTAIVHEMLASGRGVAELVVTKGLPPAEELARIPRPEVLARPSGGVADPATV